MEYPPKVGTGTSAYVRIKTNARQSSPRSFQSTRPRGARLYSRLYNSFGTGFNPRAREGKTCLCHAMDSVPRKHPRLHGEDNCCIFLLNAVIETPPLARGRPHLHPYIMIPFRNTPACTGKTSVITYVQNQSMKHPRLHGEDPRNSCGGRTGLETPPLARGRQARSFVPSGERGNTPACTGKTLR